MKTVNYEWVSQKLGDFLNQWTNLIPIIIEGKSDQHKEKLLAKVEKAAKMCKSQQKAPTLFTEHTQRELL